MVQNLSFTYVIFLWIRDGHEACSSSALLRSLTSLNDALSRCSAC